ncbi:MAG: hypothetical protein ABIZ07_00325 [Dermatophilaceae bacterium]
MPTPTTPPSLRLSRRGVLTLGGVGAAALLGGGYALLGTAEAAHPVTMTRESRADAVAVAHAELQSGTAVGSAAYVYEVDGKRAAYFVTAAFGARLERWMATWREHTGLEPDEIRSYGAWTRGGGGSWHHSGEAFDVAGLRASGKDLASARYDRWRDDTAADVRRQQRLYWRLAASLHTEFADVVTYLYDSDHANHIHVDTGRFGPAGAPRLLRRSSVQVQAVQAMCRHIWGRDDVQINGEFDSVTRDATTAILRDHGGRGELAEGAEAWRAFMVATMREA